MRGKDAVGYGLLPEETAVDSALPNTGMIMDDEKHPLMDSLPGNIIFARLSGPNSMLKRFSDSQACLLDITRERVGETMECLGASGWSRSALADLFGSVAGARPETNEALRDVALRVSVEPKFIRILDATDRVREAVTVAKV
jgi:hypothetical protein